MKDFILKYDNIKGFLPRISFKCFRSFPESKGISFLLLQIVIFSEYVTIFSFKYVKWKSSELNVGKETKNEKQVIIKNINLIIFFTPYISIYRMCILLDYLDTLLLV
ncbi:protein of unknown function [Vibrio tapetis subsp. tapetis]|uniref:Uncharacterized protein n=1 Tax=Vibrio tapetis subsp. tapetis TaxID=1671868 RepID=A0A2N8ZLU5_9VIBR|nr:protein of unknown function [Vibrio tapetis subsp. tapetis]